MCKQSVTASKLVCECYWFSETNFCTWLTGEVLADIFSSDSFYHVTAIPNTILGWRYNITSTQFNNLQKCFTLILSSILHFYENEPQIETFANIAYTSSSRVHFMLRECM